MSIRNFVDAFIQQIKDKRLEKELKKSKETADKKRNDEAIEELRNIIKYHKYLLFEKSDDGKNFVKGYADDIGELSDGYHTFNELYDYRKLYNAAFFNLLPKDCVHKSKRHHTGEECFGGGWFIVMANLPTGQISNHYEMKDWDLFKVPEKEFADEWDGHTPQDAAERLLNYIKEMN